MKIRLPTIVRMIAIVTVVSSVGLFLVGMSSFEDLQAIAKTLMSSSRIVSRLTLNEYGRLTTAMQAISITLAIFSGAALIVAGWLGSVLSALWQDIKQLGRDLGVSLRNLKRDNKAHLATLFGLTVWAAIIRCSNLGEPMRFDEARAFLDLASHPLIIAISNYSSPTNHPLSTLLMHLSASIFGIEPWALRLPTLIAGVMIVPLTYAAVASFRGKDVALLASALASASFPLVEYSTNARGYGLGAAFLLLMIALIGKGKRAAGVYVFAGVMGALALYSVPTMLYGVTAVCLWTALTMRRIRLVIVCIFTAGLSALVLYTPFIAVCGMSAITQNQWVRPLPLRQLAAEAPLAVASLWEYWNMRLPAVLVVFLAIGVVLSVWLQLRGRLTPPSLLLVTVVTAVMLLLLQRVNPPRRVWLFLLPIYLGAAAEGWFLIWRKLPRRGFIVPLSAITISVWMGIQVLRGGCLYHPGGEAYGFPNAEAFVLDNRERFKRGARVVCDGPHYYSIEYEMVRHGIFYTPTPSGEMLIITKPGVAPPRSFLSKAVILDKIMTYPYADVYLGKTTPSSDKSGWPLLEMDTARLKLWSSARSSGWGED